MIKLEIITLLSANIKRKLGTFISVVILMMIITTVMSAIFSVKDNYTRGIQKALKNTGCGEALIIIGDEVLTDELKEKIENSKLTGKTDYYSCLGVVNISCGDYSNNNIGFASEMRNGLKLYNKDLNGFEDMPPMLKSGEIYLPLGLKAKIKCNVGDKIDLEILQDAKESFILKGFVQDPNVGALTIGWKQIFISAEDMARIYEKYSTLINEDSSIKYTLISVHQADEGHLSPARFLRELNLETKIADMAHGCITQEQSTRYSLLMPDVLLNIVMVFTAFLFIIVLIVINHSIGTEIEIEYTSLGILKSQGFKSSKIRLVFFLQYILAQLLGIITGCLLSFPIEKYIGSTCQSITGILPDNGISIAKISVFMLIILLLSAAIILIKTLRLAKISPVRAISGGKNEIYFDSKIKFPINKTFLLAGIAARQFTSGKRRYTSVAVIASILVFFMTTVSLIGNLLSSDRALESMGLLIPDLTIHEDSEYRQNGESYRCIEEAERLIEKNFETEYKNFLIHCYTSLNGENLSCEIYKYPENILAVMKGRAPLYENEIIITDMVGSALDIKMGDTVKVSINGHEGDFIISGIFQSSYDSGMSFAMNFEGMDMIGADKNNFVPYGEYKFKNRSDAKKARELLNREFDDKLVAVCSEDESDTMMEQYTAVVDILKVIIYSFSILFAFVVVRMLCTKIFIQEKTDIWIYKSMGFTMNKLRISFAIRFAIVALIGTAIGITLSFLLSEKLVSLFLRLIGITKVVLPFTAMSVFLPAAALCISFFVFAYFISGRLKRLGREVP